MSPGGAAMWPCPHCRSAASAAPSRSMRWICAVCGGPVVPSEEGHGRADGELAHLVAAQRARAMAVGWWAGAAMTGASALMAAGIALLLWHASHVAAGTIAALGAALALVAAACTFRARRSDQDTTIRLEAAWASVAGELLRARGGAITAAELAYALRTDEGHAEALLAKLSADGRARVAVTEQSDLSYRTVERDDADQAPSAPRSRVP